MNIDPYDLELLCDRNEIAKIIGVGPTAVSNYIARTSDKHSPFPEAVLVRSLGRHRLWQLDEVQDWHEATFPHRREVWDNAVARLRTFRAGYEPTS